MDWYGSTRREGRQFPYNHAVPLAIALIILAGPSTGHAQVVAHDFQLPLSDYTQISQRFGEVSTVSTYSGRPHLGDDVLGAAGTPVYAAARGTVMFASQWTACPNWGHVVVIEHILNNGSRVNSIYGHMEPASVQIVAGQTVSGGQQIGTVGRYRCWGDHLHFSLRIGPYAAPVGQYPSWLAGYSTTAAVPASYVDPATFVAGHSPPAYDFRVLFFDVDGNLPSAGGRFFDAFSDGSVSISPTSSLVCDPAPCIETVGALSLVEADGTRRASRVDRVETVSLFPTALVDGAGNSRITVAIGGDLLAQQAYHLYLAQDIPTSTGEWPIFSVFGTGSGPIFQLTNNFGDVYAVDSAQVSPGTIVLLRLEIDDSTNTVVASYSIDNGASFKDSRTWGSSGVARATWGLRSLHPTILAGRSLIP